MPVILIEPDGLEVWGTAPWELAKELKQPLPGGMLRLVGHGRVGTPDEEASPGGDIRQTKAG